VTGGVEVLRRAGTPAPGRGRTVRVALAGCGTVGSALVRLLDAAAGETLARQGIRFELVSVLVRDGRRQRACELPPGALTTDPVRLLEAGAEVVVEAIGGVNAALAIARSTLSAGRRLVTANKTLVAAHGPELARLARRHGGRLDFESSVGAGIPVLGALRGSLSLAGVEGIGGVLNGTTNFVLGRVEDGIALADAVAEAQAKGFAEADPTRDLAGLDAADKLRILAWLALGVDPTSLPVRRRGLDAGAGRLAAAARLLGGRVRMVAEAVRLPEGIVASVEPTLVHPESDAAGVRSEENLLVIRSARSGTLRFSGPGAGGLPTASALLGDLLRPAARLPRAGPAREAGVRDPRAHRWVLVLPPGGAARGVVLATLARAGIRAGDPVRSADAWAVRTGPAHWVRVALVLSALEARGLAPGLLRDAGS
jgi:homoserine dehydrogenase